MATIVVPLLLTTAVMLQTTIISQITLLEGPADLVLLTLLSWIMHERVQSVWPWAILAGLLIGVLSALPIWVPTLAYLSATAIALYLKSRVWQIPILALFLATFLGTLVTQGVAFGYLQGTGTPLDLGQALNVIVLPSLLLNILFAIPVNGLISEIVKWLYPPEIES